MMIASARQVARAAILLQTCGMIGFAQADILSSGATPATVPLFQQSRPDDTPPGFFLGSFLASPSVSESASYDDNIFASDRHDAADSIISNKEEIDLTSQWSRHGLNGRFYSLQQIYGAHGHENATSYGAETTGRYDISSTALLQLSGLASQKPQARASIETSPQEGRRPLFNYWTGALGYTQRFGRWTDFAQIGIEKTAFLALADASRNRVAFTGNNRLTYVLSSRFSLFGQASYTPVAWTIRSDDRNFDRFTGLFGLDYTVPTVIGAEIGVGVLRQSFKNTVFTTLTRPVFDASLTWNIRPLTSLVLTADRTVTGTETFCDPASGSCGNRVGLGPRDLSADRNPETQQRNSLESTSAELRLEHELRHDILVEAAFRYRHDHFDFNDLNDDTYLATTGLRYCLSRYLSLELDYTHQKRTANLPLDRTYNSGPFTENILELTLKAGL